MPKNKKKYPDPGDDPTIYDEPKEELWDNVFLQQQFVTPKEYYELSD